jgi:hypothetical protein
VRQSDGSFGLEVDLVEAGALAPVEDLQHARVSLSTKGVELFLKLPAERVRGARVGIGAQQAEPSLKPFFRLQLAALAFLKYVVDS